MRRLGAGLVLANAYHLWLAPGAGAVAAAGGLHAFMGWRGNLLNSIAPPYGILFDERC